MIGMSADWCVWKTKAASLSMCRSSCFPLKDESSFSHHDNRATKARTASRLPCIMGEPWWPVKGQHGRSVAQRPDRSLRGFSRPAV